MTEIENVGFTTYVGEWPQQLGEPRVGSQLDQLRIVGKGAERIYREFMEARLEDLNDKNLSDLGRWGKVKAAAEVALAALDRLLPVANGAADDAAKIDRELARAAVPLPDEAAGAVREMEVRNFLLGLGDQGRLDAVRAAIDTNDVETLKAVAGAPKCLALVNPAIREAAEEALLRGVQPEKLQKSRDLKLAAQYAREAIDLAKSAILRAAGIEPTLAERIRANT